jgi:hypothetical protein
MVRYRTTPREFDLARFAIDQAPMAADGALKNTFPGLVESLDQIGAEVLPLGERQHVVQHAGLAHRRRQGAFPHSPHTRPAGFSDQDLLAGKGGRDLAPDRLDMGAGILGRDREILPIRQDVDGDEIDRLEQRRIAQPEFPDIGIGHPDRDLRFHRPDDVKEVGRRHLAPQQHLIANDHRGDDVGIALGQVDRGSDLVSVLVRLP